MISKEIKVARSVSITINGLKKTVYVDGQSVIDWPETLEEAIRLFGSEQKVLKKVQEIYRIREQDALARKLALERIAPERALAKEQAKKVKKLAQALQEKGLSIEDLEKMISKL